MFLDWVDMGNSWALHRGWALGFAAALREVRS
jgi:hypothetical protein